WQRCRTLYSVVPIRSTARTKKQLSPPWTQAPGRPSADSHLHIRDTRKFFESSITLVTKHTPANLNVASDRRQTVHRGNAMRYFATRMHV
ncbi:unnamed protein product, partial [Trichogramma brassicae]